MFGKNNASIIFLLECSVLCPRLEREFFFEAHAVQRKETAVFDRRMPTATLFPTRARRRKREWLLGEDGLSTIDIGRSRMLVLDQSLCHCHVPPSQILNVKYRRAAKRPKFKTSLSFPIGKQHVSRNGVVFLHSCWGEGRRNARLAASPPPGIFSSSHSKDRSPRQPFPAQKEKFHLRALGCCSHHHHCHTCLSPPAGPLTAALPACLFHRLNHQKCVFQPAYRNGWHGFGGGGGGGIENGGRGRREGGGEATCLTPTTHTGGRGGGGGFAEFAPL